MTDAPGPTAAEADGEGEGRASGKGKEAYAVLQRAIGGGAYPPGTRLKEADLAREFGMSRTPVREAIRQLERDGMVTIEPNRGAVVRGTGPEDIEDTYALRAVLEGFCASRAAVRMEATEIAHLVEIEEVLEREIREGGDDIGPRVQLNAAFHEAIAAGGGNSRVIDFLQRGTSVPYPMKEAFWQSPQACEATIVYHREIIEAIKAQDPLRAEAAMRTHVYGVRGFFIGQQRTANIESLLQA
jgi:DNA-binding GntR family transcriptional regulator